MTKKCLLLTWREKTGYVIYCPNTGASHKSVYLNTVKEGLLEYLEQVGVSLAIRNGTFKEITKINDGEYVDIPYALNTSEESCLLKLTKKRKERNDQAD